MVGARMEWGKCGSMTGGGHRKRQSDAARVVPLDALT